MIASQPDAAVGPTSSSAMTGSTHYEEGIAAGPSACHPLHTTMDGQPAAALRLRTHLGARPSWIQQHAPNIRAIDIGTPSLTPSGLHATRELRADVLTPGGHEARHTESVSYTLPPRDGEADDAARRRDERHSKRERDQLRRLSKAPVREALEAERAAARAAELAEIKQRIEQRRAEVRRDGWTLYHGQTYQIVDPRTRVHNAQPAYVFYPDGARCIVPTPFAWEEPIIGRSSDPLSGCRDPRKMVQPWMVEPDFLPCDPPDGFSKQDLVQIRIAMQSCSLQVQNGPCEGWRNRELEHEVCREHGHPLCMAFRPPGPVWPKAQLARLGVEWAANAWDAPLHLVLLPRQKTAQQIRALHACPRYVVVVQTRSGLAAELAAAAAAAKMAVATRRAAAASAAEVAAAEKQACERAIEAVAAATAADAARDALKAGGEHTLSGLSEFAAVQWYFRCIQPLPHVWSIDDGFLLCEGMSASFPGHVGVVKPFDENLHAYVEQQAQYITTIFADPDVMRLVTSESALLQLACAQHTPTARLHRLLVQLQQLASSRELCLVPHECALFQDTTSGPPLHLPYSYGGWCDGSSPCFALRPPDVAISPRQAGWGSYRPTFFPSGLRLRNYSMQWFQVPGATTGSAHPHQCTTNWTQAMAGRTRVELLHQYWQQAARAAGECLASLAELETCPSTLAPASAQEDQDPEEDRDPEYFDACWNDSVDKELPSPLTSQKSKRNRDLFAADSDGEDEDDPLDDPNIDMSWGWEI